MKTLMKRLAILALAMMVHGLPALAQSDCVAFTPEVSFCHGATAMTPFDAGEDRDWYLSADESVIMWFYVNDSVSEGISDEKILEALLKSDARSLNISYEELQVVVPFRTVEFGGNKGLEAYYVVPGGTQPNEPDDRVMGRSIVNLPSALISMNTSEYGQYPSPSNALAALAARNAFRVGGQAGVAQSQNGTTTGCDDLSAGVRLCGIRDLAPLYYEIYPNGGVELTIGDAIAEISVTALQDQGSPLQEAERFERQMSAHSVILPKWLEFRGTAPSDAGIGMMLRFPTGDGPGQESRQAFAETYFIDDGGGVNTHGLSVFLGAGYYVLVMSSNPGQGASEDHLFMLEEIFRGLRLP